VTSLENAVKKVDNILLTLDEPVKKYLSIQEHVNSCNVQQDLDFQREFNGFYRIAHRSKEWYITFYSYFESAKEILPSFEEAIHHICENTGKVETSFVSKMIATINPELPIIDKYVLEYFGLTMPYIKNVADREKKAVETYNALCHEYSEIMKSQEAKIFCDKFDKKFSLNKISNVKKIDFILWKIRRGK